MQGMEQAEVVDAVKSALEQMWFVLVEAIQDDDRDSFECHARIELQSDDELTTLWLSAENEFLTELAASMLGIDESEVLLDVDGTNALLELTNVCGGQVSRLLGGEKRRVASGLPEPVASASKPPEQHCMSFTFDSMGSALRLVISRQGR